ALPENCVLHSDQGSVYTSYEYQKAVHIKGITMSMSRKGTPADNASIESFHSSLKSETFYLNRIDRTTTSIVERTVKEYIYYYNNIRLNTNVVIIINVFFDSAFYDAGRSAVNPVKIERFRL
ncbi:integrase core domain-containing protein, partial [Amycolatopsis magusensis]|nr:integrase core domain-containing protein [Amycolatopsis magusensis]